MERVHLRRLTLVIASLAVAMGAIGAARSGVRAHDGTWIRPVGLVTIRANVSTSGRQSNGSVLGAALSANGRYVAFASMATSLVRGDRNGTSDVFVRDLQGSRTTRVSVSSAGAEGNEASLFP